MHKSIRLWIKLRSSFWFIPSLIVATSIALAAILVEADSLGSDRWLARWPRLFGAGAEGARGMLSTIAGSMMSVVGVTFSMTLVALALAASQYTSRILRIFMSSRVTQASLGIFAGIFSYCLIVLRTVRGGPEAEFVPRVAVFFGFILALGGVGVLIFFIHHIASSIQASSIIASVAQETMAAIDQLYPKELAHEATKEEALELPEELIWHQVMAERSGYIQSVDNEALLNLAGKWDTIIRMERGIGWFVVQDTVLASLARELPPDQDMISAINGAYSVSHHRTVEQDPAFGVRQIVDVAMKALSPGVNDTSTAVMCVDYLTAILTRLAPLQFPPVRRYVAGELRVIAISTPFASLLGEAFDQIRRNAGANVAIMERLLGALQTIAGQTASPSRREAIHDQLQWIAELSARTIKSAHDLTTVERRLKHVYEALEAESPLSAEKKE